MEKVRNMLVLGAIALLTSCASWQRADLYSDTDDAYNQNGRYDVATTRSSGSTRSYDNYVSNTEATAQAIPQQTTEDYYDPSYRSSSTTYTNTGTGDTYITNNYYGDDDDYYYASRIRRFHQPIYSCGYYDSWYVSPWAYNPWGWHRPGLYMGWNSYWGWNAGWGMGMGWGNPYGGWGWGGPYYGGGWGWGNPYGGWGWGNPYGGWGWGGPYYGGGWGNPYWNGYWNGYHHGLNDGGGRSNYYYGHRGGLGTGGSRTSSFQTRGDRTAETGAAGTFSRRPDNLNRATPSRTEQVYNNTSTPGSFVSNRETRPAVSSATAAPASATARPERGQIQTRPASSVSNVVTREPARTGATGTRPASTGNTVNPATRNPASERPASTTPARSPWNADRQQQAAPQRPGRTEPQQRPSATPQQNPRVREPQTPRSTSPTRTSPQRESRSSGGSYSAPSRESRSSGSYSPSSGGGSRSSGSSSGGSSGGGGGSRGGGGGGGGSRGPR